MFVPFLLSHKGEGETGGYVGLKNEAQWVRE